MASGSEGDNLDDIEEPRERPPVRAVATRGRKRGGTKGPPRRSTRSSAATEVEKQTEMVEQESDDQKTNGVKSEKSEAEPQNVVAEEENTAMEVDETEVPELEDAPPPTMVTTSVRTGLRLKTSTSEENIEEVEDIADGDVVEDSVVAADAAKAADADNAADAANAANAADAEDANDCVVLEETVPMEEDSKAAAEGNTEPVSEDELPSETLKEPDTEAVSDDELPDSKPPVPEEIPDAEEVSEDELPPDKVNRKKKTAKKVKAEPSDESGAAADDEEPPKKKKAKEATSETVKRELPEVEYDPTSPTSENSGDETSSKKEKAVAEKTVKKEAKPKVLPELEKYWKAVKDDPADFTGWTYLLQYVDQENDVEAAREAYDAFLSHYPYCYGYWRKFADYERKKGNKDKCEEVFARGLKAIPLSVDLWLHYLNYCRASENADEDFLRAQYEKALNACGMEFRSDRLWEGYIKWETEGKRLQNVTALYDRLLATPTQAYTSHFNNFQEHVSSNPPNKVLSVDEFLNLRQEVLQLLKQYDAPVPAPEDDSAPPGEEVDVPPGEEAGQPKTVHSDEETTALRERIISIRRKVHKQTVNAVSARWNFEEGIKRPYFHVKPLERCQLKNWKDYLDFEIEQGDSKRTIVLFERCLIACALYEEFWIRFVRYLQTLKDEDMTVKIRDVFDRACTIHHPIKPSLHLHWSEFEEGQKNYTKAAEILHNIERAVPGMLQLAYRRINLERRRGNLERACELYEHYISAAKNRVIANNMAIKYARFCWKIKDDIEKAMAVLRKALDKDKDCARLYLQLVSMEMERQPMDEKAIVAVLDEYLGREIEPEQKLMFAQRKVEFLEDFGADISSVQKAHEEFQRYLKVVKDRKKKGPVDTDYKGSGDGPPAKKLKTGTVSADSSQKNDSSGQNSSTHSSAPPLPPTTTATSQYPPPNYSQNGGYSQGPNQSGYQSGQYTTSQPPANYNQTYNQPYNQSGDYQNYQGWGYSQTGYSGYSQGWPGYYNY